MQNVVKGGQAKLEPLVEALLSPQKALVMHGFLTEIQPFLSPCQRSTACRILVLEKMDPLRVCSSVWGEFSAPPVRPVIALDCDRRTQHGVA